MGHRFGHRQSESFAETGVHECRSPHVHRSKIVSRQETNGSNPRRYRRRNRHLVTPTGWTNNHQIVILVLQLRERLQETGQVFARLFGANEQQVRLHESEPGSNFGQLRDRNGLNCVGTKWHMAQAARSDADRKAVIQRCLRGTQHDISVTLDQVKAATKETCSPGGEHGWIVQERKVVKSHDQGLACWRNQHGRGVNDIDLWHDPLHSGQLYSRPQVVHQRGRDGQVAHRHPRIEGGIGWCAMPRGQPEEMKILLQSELFDDSTRGDGRAAGHPVPALFDGDGSTHPSIVAATRLSGTDPCSVGSIVPMTLFWSDRRVLVTGGSGFLGRAVCAKLRERGAEVISPTHREVDLRQPEAVNQMFSEANADQVIHLAARVGGIGYNQVAPAELYLDNLLMGTYLIESARHFGVSKTVLVGTVCSYPKFTPVPFKEQSLWDGYPEETNAPYGIAKKVLLIHAQVNRAQYDQQSIFLIPTNLYGPGDSFDTAVSHVIPALIRKCVEAQEAGHGSIDVWGTGSASREYLYVHDAAEGILLAAEHYDGADPVNLGANQEITIRETVEQIAKATGFTGDLVWDPTKPDGQPRRRVDADRALDSFGWKATTGFEDGLRETVRWYRENRQAAEMPRLAAHQN
jgi:GDP-L-fucose synthase